MAAILSRPQCVNLIRSTDQAEEESPEKNLATLHKTIAMKTVSILSSEPTSHRRHTWFEPIGDALAAGDPHFTLV